MGLEAVVQTVLQEHLVQETVLQAAVVVNALQGIIVLLEQLPWGGAIRQSYALKAPTVEQARERVPVVVNALQDIIAVSELLGYLEIVQIHRNNALLESSALLEQGA